MFKKKILPILTFIILLFGMSYFPYLPAELFNIDLSKFSITMLAIYMFFCDIGYMLILFLIYKKKIIRDFKYYFKNFWNNFEISFKYYFIGLLVMLGSNIIIALFFSGAIAGNEETVRNMIDMIPLYMIFSVSIKAPFIEEVIFRLCINDSVMCYGKNKMTKWIYVLVSGFIFGALHVLGQTTSTLDYLFIIPYMSLGVSFAMLYCKTENIFSSIMVHALHNTATIILYFVAGGIL